MESLSFTPNGGKYVATFQAEKTFRLSIELAQQGDIEIGIKDPNGQRYDFGTYYRNVDGKVDVIDLGIYPADIKITASQPVTLSGYTYAED